jgi:hypothetical protein
VAIAGRSHEITQQNVHHYVAEVEEVYTRASRTDPFTWPNAFETRLTFPLDCITIPAPRRDQSFVDWLREEGAGVRFVRGTARYRTWRAVKHRPLSKSLGSRNDDGTAHLHIAKKLGKVSAIGPNTDQGLPFRLKYAYMDFNTLFDDSDAFKKDKLTIGQQQDPVIEWKERLYGYRYVNIVPWDYLGYSSS